MALYGYKNTRPRIDASAWVAPDASVIGDVELGPLCSVWFGCVLRGDVCSIRVGARSNVQDLTVFHVNSDGTPTVIEDDVTIGHGAVVHAATVKTGTLIGIGAVILDGAVIGEVLAPYSHPEDGFETSSRSGFQTRTSFATREKRRLTLPNW